MIAGLGCFVLCGIVVWADWRVNLAGRPRDRRVVINGRVRRDWVQFDF